jgi:Condensation domain
MTVAESTALSFGQLSVLRDFRRDYVGREWQANLTLAWEVPGETTVHAVHEALVTLIRRHEILRTTYRDLDAAQPVQVVHAELRTDLIAVVPTGDRPEAGHGQGRFVANRIAPGPVFELVDRPPWQALIKTYNGRPVAVELDVHHIAADAAACEILNADFHAVLLGKTLSPARQPRELADEQHSEKWRRKREGSARYLEGVFRAAGELTRIPETNTGLQTHIGSLRSPDSLRAAESIASRLGITPSTALLAAFVRSLGDALGTSLPPVYVMASNRHFAEYRELVASMNQWVPALAGHVPGEPIEQTCTRLHGLRMASLRYSCFDSDVAAELRERISAEIGGGLAPGVFLNHVPAQLESEEAEPEPVVGWREIDYTAAPGFFAYLNGIGGFTMAIRSTWPGFGRTEVKQLLLAMRTALLD